MEKDNWFTLACTSDGKDMSKTVKTISDWYDNHETIVNPYTRHTWRTLSEACEVQARRMLELYNVKAESRSGQPYFSEHEMFQDIKEGWILISKDNTDHPLMSERETFYGRLWHDLTHNEIQANFGFIGETQVYRRQVEHAKQYHAKDAVGIDHALYLDIVAQVASGLVYQCFPEQKTF